MAKLETIATVARLKRLVANAGRVYWMIEMFPGVPTLIQADKARVLLEIDGYPDDGLVNADCRVDGSVVRIGRLPVPSPLTPKRAA